MNGIGSGMGDTIMDEIKAKELGMSYSYVLLGIISRLLTAIIILAILALGLDFITGGSFRPHGHSNGIIFDAIGWFITYGIQILIGSIIVKILVWAIRKTWLSKAEARKVGR